MRTPTKKQYDYLLPLASGSAGLSRTKTELTPLLRHGWVTGEWRDPYFQFVRITPDGLRALAEAVEVYGLPDLKPPTEPSVYTRVCGECGSGNYRFELRSPNEAIKRPPRRFPTRRRAVHNTGSEPK